MIRGARTLKPGTYDAEAKAGMCCKADGESSARVFVERSADRLSFGELTIDFYSETLKKIQP